MRMIPVRRFVVFLIAVAAACTFATGLFAQDGQTLYFHTTSRAVSQANDEAFLANMRDIIKPLYAAEIEAGRLQAWYLFRTRYKSEASGYDYIVSRVSPRLADLEQAFEGGLEVAARHTLRGMSWEQIERRLQGTSEVVKTELWVGHPDSMFRPGDPARYANVAYFRNHARFDQARDLLWREVVVPFQRARLDHGISAGYAYYERRFPFDSEASYDVAEITYYDSYDQILGAGIGGELWEGIRKDNSNLGDNMRRFNDTRDYVKRELWEMVDYIQPAQ